MSTARTSTLANLRGSIERIEAHGNGVAPARMALGHAEADAALRGGLALAAVHEVFSEGRQSAAATGFIAAFVSVPIVNLATPLFGMAFMVHMHKRLSGPRSELIEPARKTRMPVV